MNFDIQLNFEEIRNLLKNIDFIHECYNTNSYATKCNIYINYELPEFVTHYLEKVIYHYNFSTHTCPIVNNCKLKLVLSVETPKVVILQAQPENKTDASHIVYFIYEEPEDLFPLLFTSDILLDVYKVKKLSKFIYKLIFKDKNELQKMLYNLYAILNMQEHPDKEEEIINYAKNEFNRMHENELLEVKFALMYLYAILEKERIHDIDKNVLMSIIDKEEILKKVLLK